VLFSIFTVSAGRFRTALTERPVSGATARDGVLELADALGVRGVGADLPDEPEQAVAPSSSTPAHATASWGRRFTASL
jgi:hypothetical protein